MTDGPAVNIWEALGVAAGVVAVSFVVVDVIAFDACGVGPLFPFAILSGTVAAVLAVASAMRRCMNKMLSEMHQAFDLGRQSVNVGQIRPKI